VYYDRYLDENFVRESGKKIMFLSPHTLSMLTLEEASRFISDLLVKHKEYLFLSPFNTGSHWVLVAIDLTKDNNIYYFDSIQTSDPSNRPEMQEIYNK